MSDSLTLSTDISAPRERVWRSLTDPVEITRWFAPSASAQPGPGGYIEISWGEGMTGRNAIEVWDPPARLVLANSAYGLVEEYQIEEKGSASTLRLTHSGFGEDAQGQAYRTSVLNGWRVFFAMLSHALGRHADQSFRNVTFFSQFPGSRELVFESLMAPGGLTVAGVPQLSAGDRFEGRLFNGEDLTGHVLYAQWPGYLVLAAESHDDSVLALLCEGGGDHTMMTVTWILNGAAAEREPLIRTEWQAWSEQKSAKAQRA